jgi:hypothetical protein
MMKKQFKYYFAAFLMGLFILSPGCTKDFEELNQNPNAPSVVQAPPEMLLTNAIESMTDRVHEIFFGHEMGSCWVQHMAKVQYPDEDRYVPRMSVINNTWNSFYASSGYDVQTIYNIAVSKNLDSYKAVALILKSYIVSVVTDEWGDVPYSEAFLGSDKETPILSPKYDTQESIYEALLANLKEANDLLNEDSKEISGDILYGNDLMKWKKFANSLRLRLLMRRSDRVNPTADITEILSDPDTYPIFTSNDDNAALVYLGSAPNNNPINENRKTRDDHRVSKTLVDIMYTNNPYVDWRIVAYANVAQDGGDFVGLPNGMTSTGAANYLGNGLSKTSKIGDYFSAASAPGMLMSYAELQFILAEAVQRGFVTNPPKTAQQYYTEGIKGSYNQYGSLLVTKSRSIFGTTTVPAAWTVDDLVSNYMANYGAWDAVNPLKKIYIEKWIAMFDQGIQSKFEWNRTNTPALTPSVANMNNGKIPVRAYYPSDESGRNPSNLQEAISRQGADNLDTRVWWDVQNNY